MFEMFDNSEKRFEQDIESFLTTKGGFEKFSWQDENKHWQYKYNYDKSRAVYLDAMVEFVSRSQPKEWARYVKYYGEDAPIKLYRRFEDAVSNSGLIYVLRNGIEDMGIKLKLCYFKPESDLNEKSKEQYSQNILGLTRQFSYAEEHHKTIDMVLSLNGIPIVALELKNQFKNQNYENAIKQFQTDRSSKEFCFRFNHRFLVYFAVDLYEAWMTTHLRDEQTRFLPFNQGSEGPGVNGGKGNPVNENGYSTSYLWEQVLNKDSLLDIIHRFIAYVEEKEETEVNGKVKTITKKKLIFPRYHQYDVVHKVVNDVKKKGAGHNYLIEHSAGSGKSNSIAWIAYRLASLHDEENKPIFNSVLVVTNRVVLDSQLQDTIANFDHTPGLVVPIKSSGEGTEDDVRGSKGLYEAINDNRRIIICTIQKFLFAYKDIDKIVGKKFAIIIDEAHQGQNGESARILRKSLIDLGLARKDYAAEEDIDETEVDIQDEAINAIIAQGKHTNQSFFAFTATPKERTLELFGNKDKITGKTRPFHIYSMRQAIEEGYILDVLANYTTIKQAFKLIRNSEENPELIEGPAARALFKYYKGHGFTIAQKTEMIMANFLHNGRFQIGKKGKAMVVADSRPNAVRYYFAIKDYLKEHPEESAGCDVLVAFSGTVKLDGKEYRESTLNIDYDGRYITSDKKLRKEFKSDRFNILVVANKYQTGFDEPLLHSMYVDKRLNGVNAVQTLSRLNRIAEGKDSTFVLDFENTAEEIKNSFQPFYEATILDGATEFNKIYDLRAKVKQFGLYNDQDVDKFFDLMNKQSGKKQDDTAIGRLANIIKPVIDRYNDLTKDQKIKARDFIRKFNKNYAYITQLVRLHDQELFKEYVFANHLSTLLPKEKNEIVNVVDKIKLEYASLTKSFEGAIILDKKEVEVKPQNGIITVNTDKKKDTLQNIIDKVNELHKGKFTESDRVLIDGIYQMFMNDKEVTKYKRYARDNNPEMFVKSLFPQKFKEIVTRAFMENNDTFDRLFNDPEFYKTVMEIMAKEVYKNLRNK